jgi:hypothetical protein
VTLLARVTAHLTRAEVPFALIGASALAAHGVSRSTVDIDLLTTDPGVLTASFWSALDAAVDLRPGDATDPLAGVVRVTEPGERDVDVVVGRGGWQHALLGRARPILVEDATVPVVDAAGLILLKLYAGGPQDAWDIEQLLAASDRDRLAPAVDAALAELPPDARALWQRIRGD